MQNKEKTFVSAVIYVHNAENRIEKFLDVIINVMENNFERSEIICVNDCSDDDSVSVIKKVSERASTTSVSVSWRGINTSGLTLKVNPINSC